MQIFEGCTKSQQTLPLLKLRLEKICDLLKPPACSASYSVCASLHDAFRWNAFHPNILFYPQDVPTEHVVDDAGMLLFCRLFRQNNLSVQNHRIYFVP
jgi:hypothetical protein